MNSNRRDFIKKATLTTAGIAASSLTFGMSAASYRRIIGANDRLHIGIAGLGRRLGAFVEPILKKENNVELMYLCDVMKSQREKASVRFSEKVDYKIKQENDIRKVIADPEVDIIINATPDHWHAPGAILALKGGKHVYVEKPVSHNMHENELIVAAQKKYGKHVQAGTQQRSSQHTIEIIKEIHDGVIGKPYEAIAFYSNNRGECPVQQKAQVREGLDWELFQGPAPRRAYTSETWDYNWHWYGWDYGTAESGNNGTHEFDVARWALQVNYPNRVDVNADKRHFLNDGWEMYDTMEATFRFADEKVIKWDGKSRNAYSTFGYGRGTIIYGTEGSVFIDRDKYILHDRNGKVIREGSSTSSESGNTLGGGGGMSTAHMENFFATIRGKGTLNAPIEESAISHAMVHFSNMAYRVGHGFDIDDQTGSMKDRDAKKLWSREYEKGWEPEI